MKKLSMQGVVPLLIVAVAGVVLGGCIHRNTASAPPVPPKPGAVAPAPKKPGAAVVVPPNRFEGLYRVTADATPFYHYGPQQPNGPDLSMKKGTDVVMVKRAFGYSLVKQMDSPQTGYVSTEDIAPLTQPELAALIAATAPKPTPGVGGAAGAAGTGRRSRLSSADFPPPAPSTYESDTLPMQAATPTPPPNNLFRY